MSKINYPQTLDLPIKESFKLHFRRTRLRAQSPRPATEREREIWYMAREAAAQPLEIQEAQHYRRIVNARLELVWDYGEEALREQGCPWVDHVTY